MSGSSSSLGEIVSDVWDKIYEKDMLKIKSNIKESSYFLDLVNNTLNR